MARIFDVLPPALVFLLTVVVSPSHAAAISKSVSSYVAHFFRTIETKVLVFCLLAQDDGLGNPLCPFFAFSPSRLEDARPNGRARECLPPFGCIENITLYLSYYVDDGHDLDPNF